MSKLRFPDSNGGGDYPTCPIGLHPGICIDILDHGVEPSPWGDRHMVSFVFKVEAEGEVFYLRRKMKFSNHEKSNMGGMIEDWTGELPAADQDPEDFYNKPCQINVIHTPKKDKEGVWANVKSVLPAGNLVIDLDTPGYKVPSESIIHSDLPI